VDLVVEEEETEVGDQWGEEVGVTDQGHIKIKMKLWENGKKCLWVKPKVHS